MKHIRQSGNVLFLVLIAVALFGALAYAFTQGSRTNVGWLEGEETKANATASAAYTQAVNMAVKRLKLRGCTDAQISYETPSGNNVNADAPADQRCHVFRLAGGGVQFQGADVAPADVCTTGPVGTVCTSDGAIYVGDLGGARRYVRDSDSGTVVFASGSANYASNNTDGLSITNILINTPPGGYSYPAATTCRALGISWYVPARDELNLLWTNRVVLNLASIGINVSGSYYATSTQLLDAVIMIQRFDTGEQNNGGKQWSRPLRCMRR